MNHFGVYSPVLGLRKDFPSILLNKAFTPDCSNVRFDIGEIQSAQMRWREFIETLYTMGTVTVSSGSATVTGSGTSWHSGLNGRKISIESVDYIIDEVLDFDELTLTELYAGENGEGLAYAIGTEDPVTKVPSPDGNPFIKYQEVTDSVGEKKLVGFTKRHIYWWDMTASAWILLFTGSADADMWSVDLWRGGIVATNFIDKPLWWNGYLPGFILLGDAAEGCLAASGISITAAKAVKVFENHIIFGNYATSDGNVYPNGCICCDIDSDLYADEEQGSATNWLQDGTTNATNWFAAGEGVIQGFGCKGELLYIFKDRSVRCYWFTGTSFVFASKQYLINVGTMAHDSIVNDANGNLYFYASDQTFREVDLGIISNAIIDIATTVNQSMLNSIKAFYIEEYKEVWWAVPYGEGITANNKVLCYRDAIWTVRDLSITCFGKWSRGTSWDWFSLHIYDPDWLNWDWPNWVNVQATSGFLADICSDIDGYTYLAHSSNTDNGSAFTSYFVLTTDLGDNSLLRAFKRLLRLLIYVRNEGTGTLSVYIKRDNESAWQNAGSVSLDGEADIFVQELPVDYRAKTYLLKFEATNKFRFLGVEMDYQISGLR